MGAKVVETAKLRPGKCAITGDTKGPFIDTKVKINRYGTLYLSLRGLETILRDHGYLSPEETESLREDNDRLQEEVRRLSEVESDHLQLVDAVREYIEPEVREVTVTNEVLRAPNDEEIEEWIANKGADSLAVQRAKRVEKGSPEEWRALYGDVPPGHPDFRKAPHAGSEQTVTDVAEGTTLDLTTDTNIVVVHDQEVDLNSVLDQNVGDVLAWAEGHDESVKEALVQAEFDLAESKGRDPRKGVIEGLGYELPEDDEVEVEVDSEDEEE